MAMVATQGTNAFGNVAAEIEAKVKIWPKMERNLRRGDPANQASDLSHALTNLGRACFDIAASNRAQAVDPNVVIAEGRLFGRG